MRIILSSLIGLAVLIGGYALWWKNVADTAEQAYQNWKKAKTEQGYVVENSPIEISDFPYRIRLSFPHFSIREPNPDRQARVEGKDLWVVMEPWNVTHVIFGANNTLKANWQDKGVSRSTTLNSDSLLGSATLTLTGQLEKLALDATNLRLEPDWRAPITANRLQIHEREQPTTYSDKDHKETSVSGRQIVLRADQVKLIDDKNHFLGETIEKLAISAILEGEWQDFRNAGAITAWRENGGSIDIQELLFFKGDTEIVTNGTLALDEANRPIGAFSANIKGFNDLIEAFVDAGRLNRKNIQTVEFAVNLLARENEEGVRVLKIPLTFQTGGIYLGPIFLGKIDPLF
ncbi:DUF2125 domain-containing protein [Sneathiella sp.]|jgi:hypothetical protein|uniref:DUF2125 domain-containing protein n=1 Tax=Sneathiella sp. TaxID=1964365 RepID=UPI0039E30FE1